MSVNLDRPLLASRRKTQRLELKTPVSVSLGPELLRRVDAWAVRRNLRRSGVVSQALTESLERWEREAER